MTVRGYFNKKPVVAIGFAAVAIAFVGLMLVLRVRGGGIGTAPPPVPKLFFTTDDGKTYFPDTIDKIPPFKTADNKTAYRVQVFKCKDGKSFVGCLEKYPDDQKKRLEELFSDPNRRNVGIEAIMGAPSAVTIVKKPLTGDAGWTSPADSRYESITQPICPGGGAATPVFPEG